MRTSLIFLAVQLWTQNALSQVENAVFTTSCRDPIPVNHVLKYKHTYCEHACGAKLDNSTVTAECKRSGICVCSLPWGENSNDVAKPYKFGEFCGDNFVDGDGNAEKRRKMCNRTCSSECSGGEWRICKENQMEPPHYVRICACACQQKKCSLTTTNVTTIPPTSTSAPETSNFVSHTAVISQCVLNIKTKYFNVCLHKQVLGIWSVYIIGSVILYYLTICLFMVVL